MASCKEMMSSRVSVECVDDPTPQSFVVVDGNSTFHSSFPQEAIELTASGEGQGPYSSVRPFQSSHYDTEDQASQDSPQTDRNSLSSPQEEEEDGGLISHQPST